MARGEGAEGYELSNRRARREEAPAAAAAGEVLVREATAEEVIHWDELVTRFANHRIFQMKSWIESIEAFSGARPLYLLLEKSGRIVACLPGFLRKLGFIKIFGSPLEGWQTPSMGPAFDPDRVSTGEILGALIPFLEKRYGVQHMELASAHLNHEAMRVLGFESESLFTYRVALFPGDEEKAMRGIHSRTRTYLRKIPKTGLVATVESSESFVEEFYEQTKAVFARRAKAVPFSRERVLQLFRHMKDSGNLLAISVRGPEDRIWMATGIFLVEGPELYLWAWTHRAEYGRYHPTELLTWAAMQRAMERGCVFFDMGGGGDAKVKFGAVPDLGNSRWIRSRYEWLAQCRGWARKGFQWQQSLRGTMGKKIAIRWRARSQSVETANRGRERTAEKSP